MLLKEYLDWKQLTLAAFAEKIGVSYATVSRYVCGKRRPSWPVLQAIDKETKGAVTPTDFYADE